MIRQRTRVNVEESQTVNEYLDDDLDDIDLSE